MIVKETPGEVRWFQAHEGYVLKQKFVVESDESAQVVWRDVRFAGEEDKTVVAPTESLLIDAAQDLPDGE